MSNARDALERVLAATEWDGWPGRARLEQRLREACGPASLPTIDPAQYLYVVTNFAGHLHLGERTPDGYREATLCRGTPAWSFAAWGDFSTHPMHLTMRVTPDTVRDLPECPDCLKIARLA